MTLTLDRVATNPAASAPAIVSGPLLPTGWPLIALFVGLPVWWAAGLGGFIQLLVPLPLVVWVLARARVVRIPWTFAPWVMFVLWVPVTALQIRQPSRLLASGYRWSAYIAATLLFLYVLGTDRRRLRSSMLVKTLAAFWVLTVIGGFVSMLLPTTSFNSPVEMLLPSGLANNGFVKSLVHPGTTSQRAFAGTDIFRPKAPFAYTNQWGAAYAVTLPFAIAALSYLRTIAARRVMQILLGASLIPLVFSLDRGAWLSASIGLGYAFIRLTWGRRARTGALLAAGLAIAGLAIFLTPLWDVINHRLENGYGDKHRTALYGASLDLARASPIFGEGAPVPISENPRSPSVGTHGQLWLVLVSHGFVGVALCFVPFALLLLRSIRVPRGADPAAEPARFWSHVAIVVAMLQIPYYMWIPWILPIILVAAAIVMRESVPVPAAAPAAPEEATHEQASSTDPGREAEPVNAPAPVLRGLRDDQPLAAGEPVVVDELGVLARGGALTFVGSIGSSVAGFLLVVAVTRGLGVREAGTFLAGVALFSLLAGVAKLGADTGVVWAIPGYRVLGRTADLPVLLRSALWRPVLFSSACAAVLFVFAEPIGSALFRDGPGGPGLVRLLAPFLPLSTALAILAAAARGFGSFAPFVFVQNLGVPFARAGLIAASALVGASLTGVALLWSLPVAAAALLCWLATRLLLEAALAADTASDPPSAPKPVRSDFWGFTLPRGVAAVFATVMMWLDVVLVGALVSSAAAGMYSAANRYVVAGTFALSALGTAIGPQISRLVAAHLLDQARALFRTSTTWVIAVSWPPALALVVFAPVFLKVFGSEYVAAVPATRILGVSLLFAMATGANKVVLLMAGHSRASLRVTTASLVAYLALNLVLIPALGINGAAIAWVLSGQVDNFATSFIVYRRLGMSPLSRGMAIVVLGSTVCFGVVGLLATSVVGDDVLGLAVTLLVGGPMYAGLLVRFRRVLQLGAVRSVLRPRGGPAAPVADPVAL